MYLDHYYSLLHDISDSCLDKIQQELHTPSCCRFNLNCRLTDCFDSLSNKVDIDLRSVSGVKGDLSGCDCPQ
jgi:hypothetical protein